MMTADQLYRYALRLLAQRDYSPATMRDKLINKAKTNNRSTRPAFTTGSAPDVDDNIIDIGIIDAEVTDAETLDAQIIEVETVMAKLLAHSLVSEVRFVENFIHSKQSSGYGPYRVAMQLKQKGIPPDVIEEQLDYNDPEWLSVAVKVLRRKVRNKVNRGMSNQDVQPDALNCPDDDQSTQQSRQEENKKRAKMIRFLAGRGFSSQQINRAVDACM